MTGICPFDYEPVLAALVGVGWGCAAVRCAWQRLTHCVAALCCAVLRCAAPCCRRQWSLVDTDHMRYCQLNAWDKAMQVPEHIIALFNVVQNARCC